MNLKKFNQKMLATLRCAEVFAAQLGKKNKGVHGPMTSTYTATQVG